MTADAKLLADMDALVAYMTDKTGKMPMPEVCDIPGTMRRAADALRRYVNAGPWIPVIERLPKPYETVAIIAEMPRGRSCGWLNSDGTWMGHDHGSNAQVTHWLPLPEDPASISGGD
jgi:hypothetical protein